MNQKKKKQPTNNLLKLRKLAAKGRSLGVVPGTFYKKDNGCALTQIGMGLKVLDLKYNDVNVDEKIAKKTGIHLDKLKDLEHGYMNWSDLEDVKHKGYFKLGQQIYSDSIVGSSEFAPIRSNYIARNTH